ncbi:MAG: RluA family pseudouridine synthase [Nanoarchaeota archaeon]|nr:RluA family pseudouridine synthase [Nanoarchaeota archaeon]
MAKLKIIFEDKNLLVIDKPAGLVVHEGSGQKGETLVDLLKSYLPASVCKLERCGLVHRLDKETSGLLLVAKTSAYFIFLKELFRTSRITKEYLALIHGKIAPRKAVIKIPIARDTVRRVRFSPARSGKMAETAYIVVGYFKNFSYLKVTPKTGRTHQIRVHFAGLGHPIVGDKIYGRRDSVQPGRQFLHAHRIEFIDPNGKKREFVAPLPKDLEKFLNQES